MFYCDNFKLTQFDYLLYYAFVTQHIKQLRYYNWLRSATCFGRYLAMIRPTRNTVKVHSLAFSNGIPLFTLKTFKLMGPVFMVKMLLDIKLSIKYITF